MNMNDTAPERELEERRENTVPVWDLTLPATIDARARFSGEILGTLLCILWISKIITTI